MTGYHDYLIVLTPAESIISDVKDLKNFSAAMIGDFESRHSKAHISVQYWPRKKPEWIDPLLPKLERDLQTLSPVVLDINGFDFFDEQYNPTIYARINYNLSVEAWFKQLRKYFNKSDAIPHITIVKSIPNTTFNKLWPHFKNREWNRQMKIDKLTILRRETIGSENNYEVFKEIPFNPRLDFYAFTNAKLKAQTTPIKTVSTQQFSLF